MSTPASQRGMTLIELIVAIVIIGISMVSVLALLASQASHSADAMIRAQAVQIADGYLNEVVQKQFLFQANPAGRINYNDVGDYNGLNDIGARDQSNLPLTGLGSFTVTVTVGGGVLGAIVAADVRLVNVTVRHSSGITVMASGYRTRY